MKKIILFAASLLFMAAAHAQVGSVTVDNTGNPCDVRVWLFAKAPSIGATCKDIYTGGIFVAAGTSSVVVTNPASTTFISIMGGPGGPLTPVPTDFQWSFATVDYQYCPIYSCQFPAWSTGLGDASCGATTASVLGPVGFCGGGHSATWLPGSGSAFTNVTIVVN